MMEFRLHLDDDRCALQEEITPTGPVVSTDIDLATNHYARSIGQPVKTGFEIRIRRSVAGATGSHEVTKQRSPVPSSSAHVVQKRNEAGSGQQSQLPRVVQRTLGAAGVHVRAELQHQELGPHDGYTS